MEMYKNENEALKDSEPTIAFIKRVKAVIDAMRSRTPGDALTLDPECPRRKVKTIFIAFLFIFSNIKNRKLN